MSIKFVALEDIKSYLKGNMYAEKYTEVTLHIYQKRFGNSEVSMFTNNLTGELFHARNTRVGWVEGLVIAAYLKDPKKAELKAKQITKQKASQPESQKLQGELF